MSATYDGYLLYDFLVQTPESALRKMLIAGPFTDVHFSMLIKFAKNSKVDEFCEHFYNGTFPKLKYNAKEIVLKEKFWDVCTHALNQHGLLSPAQKAAA